MAKTVETLKCNIFIDTEAAKAADGKLPTYEGVNEALDAVNGTALAFTVYSPKQVLAVAVCAQAHLIENLVTGPAAIGSICTYVPAGPSANSYGNSAISTRITLQRKTKGWYLVEVKRVKVYPRSAVRFDMKVTDRAADAATARLLKALGRLPPKPPTFIHS